MEDATTERINEALCVTNGIDNLSITKSPHDGSSPAENAIVSVDVSQPSESEPTVPSLVQDVHPATEEPQLASDEKPLLAEESNQATQPPPEANDATAPPSVEMPQSVSDKEKDSDPEVSVQVSPATPIKDKESDKERERESDKPAKSPAVEIEKPSDIRFLTIKNLDTGEEFIIGENDPDFEFDTFEIGAHGTEADAEQAKDGEEDTRENTAAEARQQQRRSWWRSFFQSIYGQNAGKVNLEVKIDSANSQEQQQLSGKSSSHKTPFTKLSSFKFRKELGRGAFGRVLLAEAKTDGRLYALKIISKKNMRTSDKRQAKAERDILYAMTLKAPHPFTSGLKFAFQSENNLYLGMDFIPGGNLRELIKKFKYLPEDWVRFYAAELILSISHLHSLNVLYRDIKPHNVMIDARGHLVLIDFGLSKQEISHPRGALSLVGTPDYSAPEVLRTGVQQIEQHNREKALRAQNKKKKVPPTSNKKHQSDTVYTMENKLPHIGYGKAADWWSLGIMIYEMLSGKPTFRGADLRETYQRILYSKLEFVPEERFSPAARSLLEGLINRDPSMRMGAWENPPKDIMSSPFFDSIQWDAIFERRQDGPFLPELPSFVRRRKEYEQPSPADREREGEEVASAAAWQHIVFSPAPIERMTVPDPQKEEEEKEKREKERQKLRQQKEEEAEKANNEDDDEDESESDDTDSEREQEIAMRDSVFVRSHAALNSQNQLADWSFIDEAVLMAYVTNAAQSKEQKKKDKRDKKKRGEKTKKSGESGAVEAMETIHEGAEAVDADADDQRTEKPSQPEDSPVLSAEPNTEPVS